MVRIGLIDSGVSADLLPSVVAGQRFATGAEGAVAMRPLAVDPSGHGTLVARIVLGHAHLGFAGLVVGQAFASPEAVSAALVATALHWVAAQDVHVINLSFGTRMPDASLEGAIRATLERGVTVVASAPARGPAVYPAAYPGVLSVCGDARCGPEEVSWLGGTPALVGACPRESSGLAGPGAIGPGPRGRAVGGSSCAAAHVTGLLAVFLAQEPGATPGVASAYLHRIARYTGRERRQP